MAIDLFEILARLLPAPALIDIAVMAQFRNFTVRLTGSKALSGYTKHLEFEVEDTASFGFVPGQWLSLKQSKPDGEEITRAYSIASPPDGNRFALCLNRVQDGFMSNYLCDLEVGTEVSGQGPFGNFTLRPMQRDTIFIATGTGIAPYRSMLQWLFADPSRHQGRQFWLIFGSRHEQDIYYHDEFLRLAAEQGNFRYIPTLSRGGPEWQGLRGHVQEHVAGIVNGRTQMHAYICGLDKMVSANRELLKTLGWDRSSILYEKYD